jgi:hypothetical protein
MGVGLGGLVAIVLAIGLLDPKFTCLNLADDNGFLRAIKICNITSFGEKVKPSASCRKIYGMLKNPVLMKEIICQQNSQAFLIEFLRASLLGVSWLMPESCGG